MKENLGILKELRRAQTVHKDLLAEKKAEFEKANAGIIELVNCHLAIHSKVNRMVVQYA